VSPNPRQERRRNQAKKAFALHTERQAERRAKKQADFVGPYTPKQAHKVAVKETKTEFAPTERQIASEVRGSKKREGEIDDWYSGLEDQYAQGQQAAASAAQTADAATAASLQSSSANTASLLQGLAANDSAFAAQVGGPTDAAGQTRQVEAAAAAERMRAALAAPLAAGRAIDVAGYTSKRATAALAGIQAHKENAGTRAKERSDLKALKGERGAAVVKNIQALREQDQTYTTQQKALGVKSDYNKAVEDQAAAGVESAKITAHATVAAAQAYSAAKERGASATEASAKAYAAAKKRGASAQEAVAAEQKAAAKYKADSNEKVAKIQGENAGKDKGGYTVAEAAKLAAASEMVFKTPGEVVQYLVNRGVKEEVAKTAAGRLWRQAHAQGNSDTRPRGSAGQESRQEAQLEHEIEGLR
jgi:hypothetical protein